MTVAVVSLVVIAIWAIATAARHPCAIRGHELVRRDPAGNRVCACCGLVVWWDHGPEVRG